MFYKGSRGDLLMEFQRDKMRFDASATGPNGETHIPYFKMFGTFELTLEDIEKLITGLNWIISKTPKGDQQTESQKFVMSVVRPMKDRLMQASLIMRQELDQHV